MPNSIQMVKIAIDKRLVAMTGQYLNERMNSKPKSIVDIVSYVNNQII